MCMYSDTPKASYRGAPGMRLYEYRHKYPHHTPFTYTSSAQAYVNKIRKTLLAFAALVEELAWHTYGTDTLLRRFNLFTTSIIFALFWGAWHLPLATIKGYYQANLVAEGWQYGVNFLVSVFMFVFIMNWVYAKAGRNVWIAVLFHAVANISNEIFAAHPASKIIQSGLFLILAAYLLTRDRKLFFQRGSIA